MNLNMETGTSLTINFDGELTTHGDFINDGSFIIESESTDGFAGSYINMGVIGGSGTFEFQRDVLCTGTAPGSVDPFGWHYLAAPIDGLSTDDLPEYFINVWDQPNGAWNQYSSGDCTPWPDTPLDAGAVWSINVDVQYPYAQCPGSPAPNGTLIRFEGSAADVHTGPFNTPLGYGTGEYQEWNLVANPYPSGLDLNSVVWGPNTVAGAAFFDGCSGNYTYWTPAIGSYSMAPGLGFFVETTGVGDAFAVDNSNRAHGADWFWKDEIAGLLSLEAAGSEKRDVLHVRFMDNVTAGFDNNGDFHKLFSNSENLPQIYTTAGAHKLAINALPETSVVPMGFTSSGSGSYTIRAIETSEFQQVYLQDLVTGEVANLLNSEYTFNYSTDDNADRFLIHFSPVGMGENPLGEVSIWSGRNNIYVDVPADRMGTIEVYSMMGQEVVNVDTHPGINRIPVRNVNTYYVVKVISSKGAKSGKVYVQ
jgi:hypothetical protein